MTEPAREVRIVTSHGDETCFTWLRLPSLKIDILTESEDVLPKMLGDAGENLDKLLDIAIDGAAYDGDWAGLVKLRECLLKWADQAQVALSQVAEEGPFKNRAKRHD